MTSPRQSGETGGRYQWVVLTNTTAAMFMTTLDGSMVIIALPAIFRGIHLDPLARDRGAASGMRSTFQNSGTALSIGIVFSLMIAGLASALPRTLASGLIRQGVPRVAAAHIAALPPVSSLFAAVLGVNPLAHTAGPGRGAGLAAGRQPADSHRPALLPRGDLGPVPSGVVVVFAVAAALAVVAGAASLLRGAHPATLDAVPPSDHPAARAQRQQGRSPGGTLARDPRRRADEDRLGG